jgi:hypothetical protein
VSKIKDVVEDATPPGFSNYSIATFWSEKWSALQESPIGWVLSWFGGFLQIPKEQKVNAVVLGSERANTALIVDSIESLTRMLVASLSDDVYGKAISGVPGAVRTMASAITSIEDFVQENGTGLDGKLEEVEIVVERLKAGLTELLSAFQLYLSDVGLGTAELRDARHAAERRSLIPTKTKTEPEQADQGVPAGESTNVTQKQATRSRAEQNRQEGDRSNGTTRSGSGRGVGEAAGSKGPTLRGQSQSKSRRDWNGRGNIFDIAPVRREMEMVQ